MDSLLFQKALQFEKDLAQKRSCHKNQSEFLRNFNLADYLDPLLDYEELNEDSIEDFVNEFMYYDKKSKTFCKYETLFFKKMCQKATSIIQMRKEQLKWLECEGRDKYEKKLLIKKHDDYRWDVDLCGPINEGRRLAGNNRKSQLRSAFGHN